jgi:hypothetical protein
MIYEALLSPAMSTGNIKENAPTEWVIGVFCEVFSAADAVRALNASGFEDDDIELIGVLSGRAPIWKWFCWVWEYPRAMPTTATPALNMARSW